MAFDNGHAILIGVGTYANAPQLNVPMTTADAEQVALVLGDPSFCGYPADQVTLLRNEQATHAGIIQALENLAARAAKDDTVLLFYSGHGHYGEDGAYYLTTTDMHLTDTGKIANGTAIREDELLKALQRIQAERMLLIFNACHSGEISPTLAAEEKPFTGAPLPAPTAAALLSTGSGRVIITACRENQFAYVGDGVNTIFVQALVDGLRGQGVSSQRGFISAFDLYTRLYFAVTETVQKTIPEATRLRYSPTQEPELTVLKGVGPFAVALYKGASATLGDFSAPSEPGAGTAARAVDPAESRAAFEKIRMTQITQNQTGGINLGAGNTIGSIGDIFGGDKVAGDKVMGDKRTINTGGGDYSEGTIDKRSGTFVQGDQHNVSGTFTDSNVNIGSTLSNVSQSVTTAAHSGPSEKEQLQQLLADLNATLQRAPAAQQSQAEAVATFAKQLVDAASQPQPNKAIVEAFSTTLKQVAASVDGAPPISTQIVNMAGRLVS